MYVPPKIEIIELVFELALNLLLIYFKEFSSLTS